MSHVKAVQASSDIANTLQTLICSSQVKPTLALQTDCRAIAQLASRNNRTSIAAIIRL